MADSTSWNAASGCEPLLSAARPVLGRIVHLSADGGPAVDFPGNEWGPLEARTICNPPADWTLEQLAEAEVLLLFEHEDPRAPLIVGFPRSRLRLPIPTEPVEPETSAEARQFEPPVSEGRGRLKRDMTVSVDGRRISIDAEHEIQLRCGRSSITLRQDGKIVIKGSHIVSRAEGPHRIKGGSVTIN